MRANDDKESPSSRTGHAEGDGRTVLPRRSEVVLSLSVASPISGLIVGVGLLSEPGVYLAALITVTVLPVAAVVLAHREARVTTRRGILGPAYVALAIFACYWLLILSVSQGDPTGFAQDNASLFDGDGGT